MLPTLGRSSASAQREGTWGWRQRQREEGGSAREHSSAPALLHSGQAGRVTPGAARSTCIIPAQKRKDVGGALSPPCPWHLLPSGQLSTLWPPTSKQPREANRPGEGPLLQGSTPVWQQGLRQGFLTWSLATPLQVGLCPQASGSGGLPIRSRHLLFFFFNSI